MGMGCGWEKCGNVDEPHVMGRDGKTFVEIG